MDMTAWHVVTGVITLALTMLIPLVVNLVNRINENRTELSNHKTHVAEHYSPKTDVRDIAIRLEHHMDKQFEQLRLTIKDKTV